MLKLITNLEQTPHREVDFTRAHVPEIVPIQPGGINRDQVFNRALDGQRLVFARPAGYDWQISCDYLEYEKWRELQRLKEARVPLLLFPNYDQNTRLWAPLTGNEAFKRWNPETRLMEKADATFSRSSTAYAPDANGVLQAHASGVCRYVESALGPGPLLQDNEANLCNPSSPASGTPIWYEKSSGPTGTIAWTTEEVWPLYNATGCVKVSVPAGEADFQVAFDVPTGSTSSDLSEKYGFLFYALGSVRARISVVNGSADTNLYGAYIFEHSDGWQVIRGQVFKGDAATTMTLQIELDQQPWDQVLYLGGVYGFQTYPVSTVKNTIPTWNPNTSEINDAMDLDGLHLNPGDLTFTGLGTFPSELVNARMAYAQPAAGDHFFAKIYSSLLQFQGFVGGVAVTIDITDELSGGFEGVPFWYCIRLKNRHSFTGDPERGITVFFQAKGGTLKSAHTFDAATDTVEGTTLKVGGGANNFSDYVLPQHFRWDARAWSDEEIALHSQMMLDDAFRDIFLLTQGREYVISDINMSHRSGNWDQMVGTITLAELSVDPDFALVR